jgi:hypothetical protein
MGVSAEQAAQSFVPAHSDLPHAAGVAAQVRSEGYVEALARVVFYWAYPGVEAFDRTTRANWLPAPDDQFCLIIRAYMPTESILDNSYKFPDVIRTA